LKRKNKMNLQFYLEQLQSSDEFKKFVKKYPDCFFCSAFFVIDKENPKNQEDKAHLDFYSPKSKKGFSFDLKEGIKIIPLENFNKVPNKISEDCEFDFVETEKIILEEMEKNKVKSKIQRIIFSLQNVDGKDTLIVAVFISMLGILKIDIDLSKKKVIKFEKKSFMDMFKVMGKGKE